MIREGGADLALISMFVDARKSDEIDPSAWCPDTTRKTPVTTGLA